jgi:hypothetical protein
MIKSKDGIKRRGDFFWSVGDFSFEKDTIRHIFTGQYYGLQEQFQNPIEKSKKKQRQSRYDKNTLVHDRSCSWLGTTMSINNKKKVAGLSWFYVPNIL